MIVCSVILFDGNSFGALPSDGGFSSIVTDFVPSPSARLLFYVSDILLWASFNFTRVSNWFINIFLSSDQFSETSLNEKRKKGKFTSKLNHLRVKRKNRSLND